MVFLDRVIDINYYPSEQTAASNPRWRPVGLGLMGLQDVFFELRLPFDAGQGTGAVDADLGGDLPDGAGDLGRPGGGVRRAPGVRRHPRGPRLAPARPLGIWWIWYIWCIWRRRRHLAGPGLALDEVRSRIAATGLRNSLLVAIAPTATIASIAGCYECIEPQVSNLFKRETLSGEFLQINTAWSAS